MNPLTAAAELLLQSRRPDAARPLSARERRVETAAAAGFVLAAVGLVVVRAPALSPPPVQTAVLVVTYAALARVRFALGSGFALPTQLALVPILLLLPPAIAPALVGLGLILSRAPALVARKARAERLLTSIADGWYVVAPATFLAVVAPGAPWTPACGRCGRRPWPCRSSAIFLFRRCARLSGRAYGRASTSV